MPLAKNFKFPEIPIPDKESVSEYLTDDEYEEIVNYLKESIPEVVIPGIFITPSLNMESYIVSYIRAGTRIEDRMYEHRSNYGLCDQYEQILDVYKIEDDPRALIILIVPLDVREINWDKWGPYIGIFKDPLIIYSYTIYEIKYEEQP